MKPSALLRFMDTVGAPILLILGVIAIGAILYLLVVS